MPPTVDDQSVNFAGKTRVRKVGSAALTRPPIVAGRSTSHNPPMPATPELDEAERAALGHGAAAGDRGRSVPDVAARSEAAGGPRQARGPRTTAAGIPSA